MSDRPESPPGAFLKTMQESQLPQAPTSEEVIVLPHTGELISLTEVLPVAKALDDIRAHESQLRDIKRILTDALVAESERQGSKTLHLQYLDVEIGGGGAVEWDMEELAKLQDAGLPEERYDALIRMTVSYSVDAREANRIAGANEEYARIIQNARSEVPAPHRVSVRRRK